MNRLRLFVLLGFAALVVPSLAVSARVDRGLSRPPANLSQYHKAIWMSEWVACWRPPSMQHLAKELRMTKLRILTPQQGARALSIRAMQFLYEDPAELKTAREGCRNGILWRFYHGDATS
ncbi:MAG TPA: hypothetical protein VH721_10185 [Gaiellaceae bacterium]|jgi:hypothetical protein